MQASVHEHFLDTGRRALIATVEDVVQHHTLHDFGAARGKTGTQLRCNAAGLDAKGRLFVLYR